MKGTITLSWDASTKQFVATGDDARKIRRYVGEAASGEPYHFSSSAVGYLIEGLTEHGHNVLCVAR